MIILKLPIVRIFINFSGIISQLLNYTFVYIHTFAGCFSEDDTVDDDADASLPCCFYNNSNSTIYKKT